MQTAKAAFLASAQQQKTDDYLHSTRTAPLSAYEIKAGWEIPAVLEQSLNSDLPGDIKALITSNVFDTATGRYLLIPQGSRLVGKYDSRIAYGQDGVQVVWDRIIFPDASSVDINGMVGLDSHGNSGLRYDVDHHYKRLFGFAALTSAFSAAFDLSQRNTQSALDLSERQRHRDRLGRARNEPDRRADHPAQPECSADDQSAGRLQIHGSRQSRHSVRCSISTSPGESVTARTTRTVASTKRLFTHRLWSGPVTFEGPEDEWAACAAVSALNNGCE